MSKNRRSEQGQKEKMRVTSDLTSIHIYLIIAASGWMTRNYAFPIEFGIIWWGIWAHGIFIENSTLFG